MIELDVTTHTYKVDGLPMDGLTSTIQEAGLIHSWSDPWYLRRGTAIHLATEFHDKNTLDESTVDPQIHGYLASWKRFRKDQNYIPKEIEYPTFHPILQVATTVDRLPLLDLKSGCPEPWHILQVAFQWDALKHHGMTDMVQRPMDVYLDANGGPPKVKVYTQAEMREAFKIYASMLCFIRWKREKGIK